MQHRIHPLTMSATAMAVIAATTLALPSPAMAADSVTITLKGTTATTTATTGVKISGSTVTISAGGTYQLSGSLTDGKVVVDAADGNAVGLILNGVTMANTTTSPLQILKGGDTTITLAAGSTNSLSDATKYVYPDPKVTEPDAALFSKTNLIINGTGALTVTGNSTDAIASRDGLTIDSGTITVKAVDDGIRGKDFVKINDGTITVTANARGIRATNKNNAPRGYVAIAGGTVKVTAGEGCVHATTDITVSGGTQNLSCGKAAVHAEGNLDVSAGTITVTKATDGLKATKPTISGGTITLTTSDDGISGSDGVTPKDVEAAAVLVTISGGTIVVNSGANGVSSNGKLRITGGTVVVNGPTATTSAATASNGKFSAPGGTLMATGSAAKALAPVSAESQGFVNVKFSAAQASGTIVHLVSSTGTEVVAFKSVKQFQSVIFAAQQLVPGATYRVYTGGTVTGTGIGGMYTAGSTTGATQVTTVTAAGSANPTG